MRALLLAAGVGSRLRPVTNSVPKCLVPVAGRPLMDYWLDLLFSGNDFDRALINTHWLSEQVDQHVASSSWRDRIDTVYEPELLGTGGTILSNLDYFGRAPFLVAHADNLTEFDCRDFLAQHARRPAGAVLSMLAFRTDTPESTGILELDDKNIVRAFHEKVANPPGNLANAAVYILEPEVTDFIVSLNQSVVDFSTEVIPHFLNRIFAVETPCYHRDIGTPESLALANEDFSRRKVSPK